MSFRSKGISPADLGSYIRSASRATTIAIVEDIERLTLEYRNRGSQPPLSRWSQSAPISRQSIWTFEIVEGPQTIVDHILVVGNLRTIRRSSCAKYSSRPALPWDSPP